MASSWTDEGKKWEMQQALHPILAYLIPIQQRTASIPDHLTGKGVTKLVSTDPHSSS